LASRGIPAGGGHILITRQEAKDKMGGDQGKLVKSMRGAGHKYLGVGFLLGFFLVLLTYFTVSEQFAISAPNGEFSFMFDGFCMLLFCLAVLRF
jgi:hypothetical protein